MDSLFQVYFSLGLEHILDFQGYDHMLFLLALCIPFILKDWKSVLWLATAFTIGHSLTLALSTLDIVRFPTNWVEFLIPVTIFLTALFDMWKKYEIEIKTHYFIVVCFGLIHGMGFSNFLRSTLFPGEENQLIWQLLSFNLGIELAQLLIVSVLLVFFWACAKLAQKFKFDWHRHILGALVIVWAVIMAADRWPL